MVGEAEYEWRIFGADSTMGRPIPENTPVALVNDNVKPDPDFLVHFDRTVGTDIGWTTSPGFWDHAGDLAQKAAVAAAIWLVKSQL
jgi:hypothetical protein